MSFNAMGSEVKWDYRKLFLLWSSFALLAVFLPKEFVEVPFVKGILSYVVEHLWFIRAWVAKSKFEGVSVFCYLYLIVMTPFIVREFMLPLMVDYRVLKGYWYWSDLTIKRVFLLIISSLFTFAIGFGVSFAPFEKIGPFDIAGSRAQFAGGAFILYSGALFYGVVAPASFIYKLFMLSVGCVRNAE